MSTIAREYENEERSGIDIEKAKEILREEDRFDKQRFKEKVKAKHREEKRKLKASKNAEKEAEQEEGNETEGEEEDDGSSEGDEPDLSWLPDPDKIYGKRDNGNSDQTDDDVSEDEEEIKRYFDTLILFFQ